MILTPCKDCHLTDGCALKAEKIKGVRGLKLTSIKFRCPILKAAFVPGMRVRADLKYVACGFERNYMEPETIKTREQTVDAVVMGWALDRVRIFIPYDDEDPEWWLQRSSGEGHIHILRVHPSQLHPTGERIPVCRHCGLPPDAEIENWSCRMSLDGEPLSCEVAV